MESYVNPTPPPVAASTPRLLLTFTLAAVGTLAPGAGTSLAQSGAPGQPDVILSPVLDTIFRVGTGAAEEHQLARVASVAFDASANLHILDIGSHRMSVWNVRGELVRTVGSEGEGPAEFRRPKTAFVNRDGSVAVFDLAAGAYKVFDAQGRYLRSVKASGPVLGDRAVHTDDGRWVGPHDPWMTSGSRDGRPRPLFAYSISVDAVEADTLFHPWRPQPAEDGESRHLGPKWLLAGFPDGRVALVDSVGYRVRILSPEGSVVAVLERPVAPFPVTAEAKEAERERQRNRLTERAVEETMGDLAASMGIRIRGFDPAQLVEESLGQLDELAFHEEIPVIGGLGVDSEDRLWVARTDATGGSEGPTDILMPSGEYLGTLRYEDLRMPGAFGPGGLLAFLETDDLGVQTVLVVRLVSLGGAG